MYAASKGIIKVLRWSSLTVEIAPLGELSTKDLRVPGSITGFGTENSGDLQII